MASQSIQKQPHAKLAGSAIALLATSQLSTYNNSRASALQFIKASVTKFAFEGLLL